MFIDKIKCEFKLEKTQMMMIFLQNEKCSRNIISTKYFLMEEMDRLNWLFWWLSKLGCAYQLLLQSYFQKCLFPIGFRLFCLLHRLSLISNIWQLCPLKFYVSNWNQNTYTHSTHTFHLFNQKLVTLSLVCESILGVKIRMILIYRLI